MGSISPGSAILLLLLGVVMFGSKRLASLGQDLGEAVRGFKKGLNGESQDLKKTDEPDDR